MLTAGRSLALSATSAPELPRVDALAALYRMGVKPRQGEVIMVAGRSGTQKSGFALWWTASMNLPTLYFSADMSSYQASIRLACMKMDMTTDEVEQMWALGGHHRQAVMDAVGDLNFTFAFGEITWQGVDAELAAYVELHNEYPKMIVLDNLMDIEGCESDYAAQMAALQDISRLSRETGATVLILHHASDKSWDARTDPWNPPSRDQVKGGLSEKPELSLSVGLDPTSLKYAIACIKQRMGPCDPTAKSYATFTAVPDKTQFTPYQPPQYGTAPTVFSTP